MPVTPFHFGLGALLHAVAPRHVSFIAFAAANCITDCESIYNVLSGNFPVHGFLHTLVGATLVVTVTTVLFMLMRAWARRVTLPDPFQWQALSLAAVLTGAALGGYSHIVLDGIMHADLRPFAPWSEANPLLHLIPLGALHLVCAVTAVIGVAIVLMRRNHG